MSWMGKVLGGTVGMILGGPIGAILGVVVGHHMIDGGGPPASFSSLEQKQSVYFVAMFSMLAKIARSDGRVNPEEIAVIERVMRDHLRLDANARRLAIEIFNEAKNSSASFEAFAQQFHEQFGGSKEILVSMVELLLVVAYADGALSEGEERLIERAVEIFSLQPEYEQIRSRVSGAAPQDIERAYAILGCRRGDTPEKVKRSYRRLAMEHHPDRLQANGMPEEFASVSEERFKEIQHAYDVVEKDLARGR